MRHASLFLALACTIGPNHTTLAAITLRSTDPLVHAVADGGPARVSLCGHVSGTLSKAALVKDPNVSVVGCEQGVTISSFTISLSGNGSVVDFNLRDTRLGGKVLEALLKLPSGSKLYIENVKAKDASGAERKLASISLVITD